MAEQTVAAIIEEVPSYAGALTGKIGENIRTAVQLALGGFISLASRSRGADPRTPAAPAVEGAYQLGRGEARSGRSVDALLAAYRIGARVSWREMSATAVRNGVDADTLASFAELVFAYIDELSAASVAGHTDELDTTGRVRQRLPRAAGAPPAAAGVAGDRAGRRRARGLDAAGDADRRGGARGARPAAARVAGAPTPCRPPRTCPASRSGCCCWCRTPAGAAGRRCCGCCGTGAPSPGRLGPGWRSARRSTGRSAALALGLSAWTPRSTSRSWCSPPTRRRSPTCGCGCSRRWPSSGPTTAEKLTDTLRSWLLHHGRREDIAAELFVHPQTVRYRMGQLRELYGDRLDDPATVLELTHRARRGSAEPAQQRHRVVRCVAAGVVVEVDVHVAPAVRPPAHLVGPPVE